jgi:hypothetical protein
MAIPKSFIARSHRAKTAQYFPDPAWGNAIPQGLVNRPRVPLVARLPAGTVGLSKNG